VPRRLVWVVGGKGAWSRKIFPGDRANKTNREKQTASFQTIPRKKLKKAIDERAREKDKRARAEIMIE